MNVLRKIKDIFINLFQKFSLENLFILFIGIVIGFFICLMIYLVFVFLSLKKSEKKYNLEKVEISDEKIARLIRSAQNHFTDEYANQSLGEKINGIKLITWNLINDIAKAYYPKSSYPIYELSLNELLILNHYITERVDTIFQGVVLRPLKKLKISNVLILFDIKKKFDDNIAVKTANKLKLPEIFKTTLAVLNIFNPVYLVRKLMVNTTLMTASNKICMTIIDVVGEETDKIYSKSVFNQERADNLEIEKSILELESLIEKE